MSVKAEIIGDALRKLVCARGTIAGTHLSIVGAWAWAVGTSQNIQIDIHAYLVLQPSHDLDFTANHTGLDLYRPLCPALS